MNHSRTILPGLMCLATLAAMFCAWSAAGNEVNFCVTAGCAILHDVSLAGVSLWWCGAAAFALLGVLGLAGLAWWGCLLAGLALLGDMGLLLVMATTAPCVSCLVVAAMFALLYAGFRRAVHRARNGASGGPGISLLLLAWGALFLFNAGMALRGQTGVWSLTDNAEEATVRMFFSPSCPSCREGVELLSGHVDVAFYPVAENEADIARVLRMTRLLDEGASMAEAVAAVRDVSAPAGLASLAPEYLLLRLRMLRNRAHVMTSGSQTIPFLEYQGLPAMLRPQPRHQPAPAAPVGGASLPLEPQVAGQCPAGTDCP